MTTPVSAATPASAMNPTATATDKLNPSHHISQSPPTKRERQRQHDDQRLGHAPEVEVEQQEDDDQGQRDHDRQTLLGALVVFELAAPDRVIALGETSLSPPPPCAHRPRSSPRSRSRAST